jgi:ZIP family zinc transporter
MEVILGILIPFIGTILGSLLVYIMKKEINKKIEIIIYGFAAGVMMAALIWSLIIPAMEQSVSIVPIVIGLVIGVVIFL